MTGPAPSPAARGGRGRPAIGPEVKLTVPVALLKDIDDEADRRGTTRAAEIRRRCEAMSRI